MCECRVDGSNLQSMVLPMCRKLLRSCLHRFRRGSMSQRFRIVEAFDFRLTFLALKVEEAFGIKWMFHLAGMVVIEP